MDRRSLIKNAGITGVLAAGVAPAVHAQATVRWRMAASFPKSLDTCYGSTADMCKRVGELTDGKFTISLHAPGELVPALRSAAAARRPRCRRTRRTTHIRFDVGQDKHIDSTRQRRCSASAWYSQSRPRARLVYNSL